jgi:hypothetical protein
MSATTTDIRHITSAIDFASFPQEQCRIEFANGDILPMGQEQIVSTLCRYFAESSHAPTKNTARFASLIELWRAGLYDYARHCLFTFADCDYDYSQDSGGLPSEVWQWKSTIIGRAKYVGTITKRISKWVYNLFGIKLDSATISAIGNIANDYTEKTAISYIDFTDSFDWRAGEYGDSGSCFWGSNSGAKECLEQNGAHAIRFYDSEFDKGIGRAWIAPYCDGEFRAYVVFNAYGKPGCHNSIGRLLSQLWGCTYKRVGLSNENETSGLVYINSGKGTLVYCAADSEYADDITSIDLDFDTCSYSGTPCCHCGDHCDDDNSCCTPNGETCCEGCYCDRYGHCARCEETCCNDDLAECADGDYVCEDCRNRLYTQCNDCNSWHRTSLISWERQRATNGNYGYPTPALAVLSEVNGDDICEDCIDQYAFCDCCQEYHTHTDVRACDDTGECYCKDCIDDGSAGVCECDCCDDLRSNVISFAVDFWYGAHAGRALCASCLDAPNQLRIDFSVADDTIALASQYADNAAALVCA